MKFAAIVLAALFVTSTAAPADAARKTTDTFNGNTSFSLLSSIPGLNGCC